MQYHIVDSRHFRGERGYKGGWPRYVHLGKPIWENTKELTLALQLKIVVNTSSLELAAVSAALQSRMATSWETAEVASMLYLANHLLSPATQREFYLETQQFSTQIKLLFLWGVIQASSVVQCVQINLLLESEISHILVPRISKTDSDVDVCKTCKTWHDLVKKWMSFEYLHKFSTVEQRFVQDRTMEQNKTFDNISNQIAEC